SRTTSIAFRHASSTSCAFETRTHHASPAPSAILPNAGDGVIDTINSSLRLRPPDLVMSATSGWILRQAFVGEPQPPLFQMTVRNGVLYFFAIQYAQL